MTISDSVFIGNYWPDVASSNCFQFQSLCDHSFSRGDMSTGRNKTGKAKEKKGKSFSDCLSHLDCLNLPSGENETDKKEVDTFKILRQKMFRLVNETTFASMFRLPYLFILFL